MIHLYTQTYEDPAPLRNRELVEALSLNRANPHLNVREVRERLTYGEMFALMRREVKPDDVCVLANSDIYFDDTAELLNLIEPNECYALTRWEPMGDRLILYHYTAGSQDAWAFRGPPPEVIADFYQGKPGCDSRIAAIISAAGYKVSNPCGSIRGIHLHASAVRRYSHADTVRGAYLEVQPCSLTHAI